MSSDFNFTVASSFLENIHVKPISTHNAPQEMVTSFMEGP